LVHRLRSWARRGSAPSTKARSAVGADGGPELLPCFSSYIRPSAISMSSSSVTDAPGSYAAARMLLERRKGSWARLQAALAGGAGLLPVRRVRGALRRGARSRMGRAVIPVLVGAVLLGAAGACGGPQVPAVVSPAPCRVDEHGTVVAD